LAGGGRGGTVAGGRGELKAAAVDGQCNSELVSISGGGGAGSGVGAGALAAAIGAIPIAHGEESTAPK